MADVVVRSVKRVWEQLGGESTEAGETFSVGYVVELSDPTNQAPRIARNAIPFARGASFAAAFPAEVDPADASGMICQSIGATVRQNAPWAVDVVAKFGVPAAANGGSYVTNPIERPPTLEWICDEQSYTPVEDLDKKAVANSSGEPLEITAYRSNVALRVRFNRPAGDVTGAWLNGLEQRVNSDAFYGAQAGQARIRSAAASVTAENGVSFAQVTLEIVFREVKWNDEKYRDRGRRTIIDFDFDDDGDFRILPVVPILGGDGQPVPEPVDLDGAGGVNPDGAEPQYLDFRFYDEIAFSTLGIGGSEPPPPPEIP